MTKKIIYGGIEAGGTKIVCATGSGSGELIARQVIETTTPTETLNAIYKFFKTQNKVTAIGVGSFGPLDLNTKNDTYGSIINTTKPGWNNINIPQILKSSLQTPVSIVTDTDAAAIGERYHGKAINVDNFVYITIGTGIGGSVIINGKIVHGISHPEIGHMRVPVKTGMHSQTGVCTYHTDCLEGMASGKSLEKLTGVKAEDIVDHNVWNAEALILASAIVNIISVVQPERIIIGGSVMKRTGLIDNVRKNVDELLGGYYEVPNLQKYLVPASSDTIGVLGAIKLGSLTRR